MTSQNSFKIKVWSGQVKLDYQYEEHLQKAQRRAVLRICATYRTVPTEALLVLAGVPPITLLAAERQIKAEKSDKNKKKAETMKEWQKRWDDESRKENAVWTKTLIKDIGSWVDRRWSEINHWITQAFTGRGDFGVYLQRFGKKETDRCRYCGDCNTALHTIFKRSTREAA